MIAGTDLLLEYLRAVVNPDVSEHERWLHKAHAFEQLAYELFTDGDLVAAAGAVFVAQDAYLRIHS